MIVNISVYIFIVLTFIPHKLKTQAKLISLFWKYQLTRSLRNKNLAFLTDLTFISEALATQILRCST